MRVFSFSLLFIIVTACNTANETNHSEPTHNFTVDRILIINEKNELLLGREQNVWAAPYTTFNKRQFINESIDSIANALGISISKPELRGYFGFKYEYHPYATRRAFFVAQYLGGTPKVIDPTEEYQWMSIEQAIDSTIVDAWAHIYPKIINQPKTVWGGSFEVFRDGTDHRTRITEEPYPLFTLEDEAQKSNVIIAN